VIVYCHDEDCDASPKAARRMDALGYQRVYDYEAGKVDWKQAGLPVEQ
jgi:rhodanese-related sulfurtransferase